MIYEFAVIGAGIIGANVAYRLSRFDAPLVVLDRQADVANEVTMANSAIVHTGHDPEDGTLKAKLNVRGARMYPDLCEKLGVKYARIGSYTVMTEESQEEGFNDLVRKCKERGVAYEILDRETALKNEPNLTDKVIKVLHTPEIAVIEPWEVSLALLQTAVKNGAEIRLNTEVTAIEAEDDLFVLHTDKGEIRARYIFNCAGIGAVKVADLLEPCGYTCTPRKGEYFVLSHNARDFVHHVIYPMPTAKGKGVLAVPTVDHNILIGPNAQFTDDFHGINNTASGLADVRSQIGNVVKNLPYADIIRTFAGLRPSLKETRDFVIEPAKDHPHMINFLGIDSPGIASAPAIAEYAEQFVEPGLPLKEHYEEGRPESFHFGQLTIEEKDAWIKQHPAYGHIVCRCEQISEGEIIEAIRQPLGARSVKGVKKRVRPGMGKCQGGFCEPLVVDILARELGIPKTEVLYDGPGSNILMEKEADR